MKSESKIWAFGCSFTEMFVSSPYKSGNYYYYSELQQSYHWLNVLNTLFGNSFITINLGVGGSSIKSTLHHLLLSLPRIQKGDKVIIGHTSRYRDSRIISKNNSDRGTLDELHFNASTVPYIANLSGSINGLERIDLENLVNIFIKTSQSESILDIEYDYYQLFINNIGDVLVNCGVEVYKWYTDIWSGVLDRQLKTEYSFYPEDIKTWSSNVLVDDHWSPNGHQLIGIFFKFCIDNNITEFTKKNFNRFNLSFDLKNLPFPYLPY